MNRTHVEISERTLSILAFGLAIAAFATALWSTHDADRTAQTTAREVDRLVRETKQLQVQVMDQNALLIREGLKQPGDTIYGPAGNLEYKPRGK